MKNFIEETTKEIQEVEKKYQELSARFDEVSKILKRSSFEKRSLELSMKNAEGIIQAHRVSLNRAQSEDATPAAPAAS